MKNEGQTPVFEVYCHHCDVTSPLGARHCLHCGGRLSQQRGEPREIGNMFTRGNALRESAMAFAPDEALPEEDTGRRASAFSPVALIWVLLFVVGTLYRACTSG